MTTSSTETQEPLLPSNDQISEAPTEADLDLYESLNGASVIATQEAILPTKDSLRESSRILHAYLAVAILVNFCLLFLKESVVKFQYSQKYPARNIPYSPFQCSCV